MELETAFLFDLKSELFKITKIKKPKSVYVAYLDIHVNDVFQIKCNPFLSKGFFIENLTNGRFWSSFNIKDLKNMFNENGCFDFIKIESSDENENENENETKQSTLAL